MKSYHLNVLRFISKALLIAFITLSSLFFMFYLDSGRNILLNAVSKYFQTQDIVFKIHGLDRGITNIRQIFIRSPDGIELIFSDVKLSRKNILDRFSIYVDKFVLNGAKDEIDLNSKLKDLIPLMRKLRFFINNLTLGNGFLYIAEKTYLLEDLKYRSEKKEDYLYSKINKNQSMDVLFKWDGSDCTNSNISFEQIFGLDGRLFIKKPEGKISEYKLMAKNKLYEINSKGNYQDFMFDINIKYANVKYKNHTYNCSGNLYPEKQKTKIKVKINSEDLYDFSSIPKIISSNFKDVYADVRIDYDFYDRSTSSAGITFNRGKNKIGNLECFYKNKKIELWGDISWINILGFSVKKLKCEIENLTHAKIKLSGENFEVNSNINFNDKILIKDLDFYSKKGIIKSTKPFLLSEKINCSFDFSFNQLDFWDKIVPISGSGFGNFSYENGALKVNGNFPKFCFDNHKFYESNVTVAEENFNLISENAKMFNINFKKLSIKTSNNLLSVSAIVNNIASLSAHGNISEFYKKISMKKVEVKSPSGKMELKTCNLDLSSNKYRIEGVLFDEKNENKGELQSTINPNEIFCSFKNFQTNWLSKIFNNWAPNGSLSGNLNLKKQNGFFVGEGIFISSDFMTRGNLLKITSNTSDGGTKISVSFKNHKDEININSFLPIKLKTNGKLEKNLYSNLLRCHIYGNAKLEKLLELPDKSNIRGNLNGDLRVTGSFANPMIEGKAKLQNAYIAIEDILLKNGTISLHGKGTDLIVSSAEFIDRHKRKLQISGGGKFFFDGITPNINTNLQFDFNNFILFDSEKLKINVNGNGDISGPINELLISGKLDITKFELSKFGNSNKEKNDLLIENDPYLESRSSDSYSENDFFKYDIKMHCPKIKFIGDVFEIMLFGDLHLSTYNGQATLIGELKLSNGKLDLFGKRMIFTKGFAIFTKESPFDPKAFFSCKRNFGDIVACMNITNTPQIGVSIDLYSTPSYTKDIILSKMLFGKEMKYLSVSEAAQLAHAIASLNQRGYIFSMLNTFQNIGLVDNISFATEKNKQGTLYSDTQNKTKQNNVSVSAGKYIYNNVYISVNKKEDSASFDIDFSITPKFSIKANTNGEAGISWKYRY